MRRWWLWAICIGCAGCGFQLRQHTYARFPTEIHDVGLTYATPVDIAQQQALADALVTAGVAPVAQAPLQIVISDASLRTEPLAFGIDGEVHRERILCTLTFRVLQDDHLVLPPQVITASQERVRFSNYDLADASDKERIVQHLQATLAQQITTRVATWLATPPTEPSME